MRHPLVDTINKTPLGWSGQKPLDVELRGPKILTEIVPAWSPEHAEVAKHFAEARAAARRRYGRS
jgi:hypothetical protein